MIKKQLDDGKTTEVKNVTPRVRLNLFGRNDLSDNQKSSKIINNESLRFQNSQRFSAVDVSEQSDSNSRSVGKKAYLIVNENRQPNSYYH